MKIFVISLLDSEQRRKNMKEKLRALPFTFFNAFDARKLNDAEYQLYNEKASEASKGVFSHMSRGEFGCTLSHLQLYQHIIENNISAAVVLEDDVALTENGFRFIKAVSASNVQKGIEMLMLGYSKNARTYHEGIVRSVWKRKRIQGFAAGTPVQRLFGSFAYLITLEGAKKMLQYGMPVRMPADIMLNNAINAGVRYAALRTPVVMPDEDNDISFIGTRKDFFFESDTPAQPRHENSVKKIIPAGIRQPIGRMLLRLKNQLYLWRIFHPKPWASYTYDF